MGAVAELLHVLLGVGAVVEAIIGADVATADHEPMDGGRTRADEVGREVGG